VKELTATDPYYSGADLHDHLAKGGEASWSFFVQVIPEKDGENYRYDIFDVTKVWPHSDYPLQPVGQLVLNKNPDNYFAEVE